MVCIHSDMFMCVCICICRYVCVSIQIESFIHTFSSLQISPYSHMSIWIYSNICKLSNVHVHNSIWMSTHTYLQIHIYTNTYTHSKIQKYTYHTHHMFTSLDLHIYTHIHTFHTIHTIPSEWISPHISFVLQSLLDTLHSARPNMTLLAADFSFLPEVQLEGQRAPIIASKEGGVQRDHSTYLVTKASR